MVRMLMMAALATGLAVLPGCLSVGKRDAQPTYHEAYSGVRGTGDISYRAPADGVVQVVDEGKREVIFAGPVRAGDEIQVKPRRNEIQINGQTVSDRALGNGAMYSITLQGSGGGYPSGYNQGYYPQQQRPPYGSYDPYRRPYDRGPYVPPGYDRRARDW